MKFSPSAVGQVLWADVGEMTHHNLPLLMVEHWTYAHHLNGVLVNLVDVLALDCRARHRPLNPSVKTWKQNNDKMSMQNANNETVGGTSHAARTNKEWMHSGKVLTRDVRRRSSEPIANANPCDMLVELDEGNLTCGAEEMTCKMQSEKEVERLKMKSHALEESHDVESITVDALEGLIRSLNDDQMTAQQQSVREMKKIKLDFNAKMRHKDELIKSKEKRLKFMRDDEGKYKLENEELRKQVAMKEAEALSFVDVMEENVRFEGDNENLNQEVKELERNVSAVSEDCKKSKTEVKVLINEVKAWKEKHKKLEYSHNTVDWLGNRLNDNNKKEARKTMRQARGKH